MAAREGFVWCCAVRVCVCTAENAKKKKNKKQKKKSANFVRERKFRG